MSTTERAPRAPAHSAMIWRRAIPLFALCLIFVAGCRSLDPQPTIAEAHTLIEERLELSPRGGGETPHPNAVLELSSAIELAWSAHPTLARELAQLRRDHADWIQADRLPNPMLNLGFGTVLDGAGGSPLRSSLLAPITALLTRPARLAAAESTVRAQVLRLADTAIDIAEKVTRAAIDVEYHHRRVELDQRAAILANEQHSIAIDALAAGGTTRDEVAMRAIARAQAEDQRTESQLALELAERALLETLGQSGAAQIAPRMAADSLPTKFEALPSESDLVGWVALRRYDVAAAIADAESAGAQLRIVGIERFGTVGGTIGLDRNFQDREAAITGIRWEIPLFDQGGARRARAAAERDRKIAIAEERLSLALRDARQAWVEVTREHDRWLGLRDRWVPAAEHRAELAREEYEIGEGTRTVALEREREALAANRRLNETERRLQLALAHLTREAGGSLIPPTLEEVDRPSLADPTTPIATSQKRGDDR